MTQPPPASPPAAPTTTREVELKLHVAPGDLARLATLPALLDRADGPPVERRLRTVYYDTPDLKLFTAGIALRIRREDGRFTQTLKTVNSAAPGDSAAVAIRREWDWTIPAEQPDLSLLAAEGLSALVPADARDAIVPLVTTEFRRTTLLVRPDPLTAIEVALDEGAITAGAASHPICEVELELQAGRVGRLFDLALLVQRAVPVRIGTESKAELGLRLVTGKLPAPVLPEPLALSPVTTVAEAWRHIVRHGLRQLLANEPCTLAGGDTEGLHQIRVALRRLNTAHRLFRLLVASPEMERLHADLRAFAKQLAPARGWDVLLTHAAGPLSRSPDAPDGLPALAEAVRAARAAPTRAAVEAIASPRCSGLILALGAWLEDGRWHSEAPPDRRALLDRPVADLAGPWLSHAYSRARKAAKPVEAGRADTEQRNRLRRRLRTLRYVAEFFRGLYPETATLPFIATLEAMQQALDADHDAMVAKSLLRRLDTGRATAKATASWLCKTAGKQRKALPALWKQFRETPAFWA